MISLPTSIKTIKTSDNYATFEIEPFYPGYGITIGNALRRVLLSSLQGCAVSEAKITNAPHEFSTLPGVKEDVLHILMNLKGLRFKIHSDEPQVLTLKVKGEKKVTASDFELSQELELINPEHFIATLTDKKSEIEIEIKIEKGFGYKFLELDKDKQPIGTIALDQIFTPIKKVNYKVENVRVGERTDFDKLTLELETDGSIDPKEALLESIKILTDHFRFLEIELNGNVKAEQIKETVKKVSKKAKESIDNIEISKKTVNALIENGIETVGDLTAKTEDAISAIKGVGKKGIKEINKALEELGEKFKD